MFIPGIVASTNWPKGDFESIATVTVGSGGASSIDFTSIPGTFQHLQLRGIWRSTRTGASTPNATLLYIQYNGTTSTYRGHQLQGDGASPTSTTTSGSLANSITPSGGSSSLSNTFSAAVIDILDYANTNKATTMRSLAGLDLNGSGIVSLDSGLWTTTDAITSIKLQTYGSVAETFPQYSTFALYGIKG